LCLSCRTRKPAGRDPRLAACGIRLFAEHRFEGIAEAEAGTVKSPPSCHLLALEYLGQLGRAEALPFDKEEYLSITFAQRGQCLVNHILLGGHRFRLQTKDETLL
jgi:hypothetical protein